MTCATSPVLGVLPVQHLVILLSRTLLAKIHEKPNGSLWLSPFYIWARSFLLLLQETFHGLGLDQWAQLGWSFGGLPWQVCFQLWEKSLLLAPALAVGSRVVGQSPLRGPPPMHRVC